MCSCRQALRTKTLACLQRALVRAPSPTYSGSTAEEQPLKQTPICTFDPYEIFRPTRHRRDRKSSKTTVQAQPGGKPPWQGNGFRCEYIPGVMVYFFVQNPLAIRRSDSSSRDVGPHLRLGK